MCTEPLASLPKSRAGGRHQAPVCRRMIEPFEMHELMNHHVLANPFGHGHQAPVEADMTVPSARTPSRALVPDADSRDAQPVLVGKGAQPARQCFAGLLAQLPPLFHGEPRPRQRGPLTQDPVNVPPREGIGFAFRPAARNGHAHAAVELDAQQIAAGAAMTHEIDRSDRARGGGGDVAGRDLCARSWLAEWKAELHGDSIPDCAIALDTPAPVDVIFITLVRGT